jgi:hypothetical protein
MLMKSTPLRACRPLPVAMVLRFAALPVRRRIETDKPLAVPP